MFSGTRAMSLAGVSFLVDGEATRSTFPVTALRESGLLVLNRYSRTKDLSPLGDCIQHLFVVGGYRWRFEFYPNGNSQENHRYICFGIYLAGGNINEPLKVHIECSFIDQAEEQKPNNEELYEWNCHGAAFSVEKEVVEGSDNILLDDRFTVRCDFSIFTAPPVAVPPPDDILQRLRGLLLSGEGTDVTIQVGGETLAAHRCVLAAQSAVFKAELFGPNKEGTTNTVMRIDDMEARVFELLLCFMYSDLVPEIEDDEEDFMWKDLLVAADRFGLLRLRLICEQKLCTCIDASTVAIILALAEQHHCRGLKDAFLDFLSNPANLQEVLEDDGLDHLTSSCPSVLKELIAKLASLMLDM